MSGDGSHQATLAALAANIGVAVTKFVAFMFTGSSAMLAEGIHSVADSGNQALLMLGRRRAAREPSPAHPFGYGRERYFYGFLVSVVLFFGGGLFALFEGYEKITHSEPLESWPWAIGVLVGAIAMESFSLRTAVRSSNRVRGRRSWARYRVAGQCSGLQAGGKARAGGPPRPERALTVSVRPALARRFRRSVLARRRRFSVPGS